MIKVNAFTFNPFQENTYVLSDETGDCVIIDPGCYERHERDELERFIGQKSLKPVRLVNTHCHIDHVMGNRFCQDTWKLQLELNFLEIPLLQAVVEYGSQFGLSCQPSKEPYGYLNEGDELAFGKSLLSVFHTPGHSPGSLCLYARNEKFVIGGDVLFQQSIGRTDLPGGDYETLLRSIRKKLFSLPDDVTVYSGHGPATTIGFEKKNNPFLAAGFSL